LNHPDPKPTAKNYRCKLTIINAALNYICLKVAKHFLWGSWLLNDGTALNLTEKLTLTII